MTSLRVIGFSILLFALPAFARTAPSEAERAKARALMDEGDRRVEQGDYPGALSVFREADGIMGVPTTGIEVARTLAALGKLVEAREVALAVTRIPVRPGEARVFDKARRTAAALAQNLERRIPSLEISVSGVNASDDVEIRIDGVALPRAELGMPHPVDPGEHSVVVTAPGYLPKKRSVTLAETEHRMLAVQLSPVLEARVAPRAPRRTLPPTVEVRDDGGTSPLVPLGFGIGAAGLLVGGVAGGMSLSRAASAKELCSGSDCPPDAQEDLEAADTWGNISNVGFAVGVLGVGVGIAGLLSSGGSEERPRAAKLEPLLGPRMVGVRGSM